MIREKVVAKKWITCKELVMFWDEIEQRMKEEMEYEQCRLWQKKNTQQ